MKIIQSYWSLPSLGSDKDIYGRSNGGFIDARFNYMSWALSCLTLKRFYKNVELITDKKGKELLIDTLNLPYTNVTVCLDELNHYHPKLWAIGKIKAYQLQDEPFLHVDGDIFIWKAFGNDNFHRNPLIVQNMDYAYSWYDSMLNDIESFFEYIPQEIIENYTIRKDITAINAGIIGGSDIDFFQRYTHEAFEFVNRNINCFEKINIGLFNNVFEQYLFYAMAFKQNKPIMPFLNLKPHEEFTDAMNFHLLPNIKSFIHLIGYAKDSIYACEQVEMRLRYEFPDYYNKIIKLFKDDYFPKTQERYKRLKPIYNYMQNSKINDILNTSFKLSSNVQIISKDGINALMFKNPLNNETIETDFKDWDMLLEAFQEVTTGNEVLEHISEGSDEFSYEKMKFDLVDFLTDRLTYHGVLDLA
jgi:hypothetical protein